MKNLFLGLAMVFMASVGFAGEKVSDNSQIVVEILVEGQDVITIEFDSVESIKLTDSPLLTNVDCTMSVSGSYLGAEIKVSITADTCKEAWEGVKEVLKDVVT